MSRRYTRREEGPVGPVVQQAREREQRNAAARRAMFLAQVQRASEERRAAHIAQIEREQQARRELDEYAHQLAVELDRRRQRNSPNPWLQPGDPDYVSPEEFRLRQQLRQKEASGGRASWTSARPQMDDVDRTLARSQAQLSASRRRQSPTFQDVARRFQRGR